MTRNTLGVIVTAVVMGTCSAKADVLSGTVNATAGSPSNAACALFPSSAAEARRQQDEAALQLNVPVERTIELPGRIELPLMLIPAGEFMMGNRLGSNSLSQSFGAKPQWFESGYPLHRVRLTRSFYMGKYEVTQDQWRAIAGENPSTFQDAADHGQRPVETVTWVQITETFIEQLSPYAPKGWVFRLPTEAEWEYACRAGSDALYACGDTLTPEQANITFSAGTNRMARPVRRRGTVKAGSFPSNPWGLYDMTGNVWEYCLDGWNATYYAQSPINDPYWEGDRSGSHVLRGGSYDYTPAYGRAAHRGWNGDVPEKASPHRGFRVVLVPTANN